MCGVKRQPHAEFPQFRSKLAAMGARKRQSFARESLHSMERTLSPFVPAEEVQKLGSLAGTRNRWLPLPLAFWSFLQMVMDPDSFTREAQRSIQAWWRQKGLWIVLVSGDPLTDGGPWRAMAGRWARKSLGRMGDREVAEC